MYHLILLEYQTFLYCLLLITCTLGIGLLSDEFSTNAIRFWFCEKDKFENNPKIIVKNKNLKNLFMNFKNTSN